MSTHKKFSAVFFVGCCFIVLNMLNLGCTKKSSTSPGPIPTQTPNYVMFNITNSDSGATKTIVSVQLVRNSDSSSYSQSCSITAGTSADVSIGIPATDSYNVNVNGTNGYYVNWCAFSVTLGSTHTITVSGNTSAIDSHWVACQDNGL